MVPRALAFSPRALAFSPCALAFLRQRWFYKYHNPSNGTSRIKMTHFKIHTLFRALIGIFSPHRGEVRGGSSIGIFSTHRGEVRGGFRLVNVGVAFLALLILLSCQREPDLHLHNDSADITMDMPAVDFDLSVYWDYIFNIDVEYDWKAEWVYGWDDADKSLFGDIGYTDPTAFEIRRYYTHDVPMAEHEAPYKHHITGSSLFARYNYGYWDILAWNDIQTADGIQSIRIDEESSYDYVLAHTGQSMIPTRYETHYTRAFYQPEELFSAYERGIEINRNLDNFEFDKERNCWVRKLKMVLQPVTYIYLIQVILHNNNRNGRIVTSTDGNANLCGMARTVTLNTGITGDDAITVHFNARMKKDVITKSNETVDIIGGKVLTFGIPKLNPNTLSTRAYTESLQKVRSADLGNRHYFDVTMQFRNGMDSTFVFDVTDKVRKLFRGGVITLELDMDTVPVPTRKGGSGFDAVVKDFEEKQWEFDM